MSRRYVGEGELSTLEVLGGKAIVVPLVVAPLVVLALTAFYATREGAPAWSWVAPAGGMSVPLWFAWRNGFFRALASVLRGDPRPWFHVELDELTVRTWGRDEKMSEFDWFEIERFNPVELGLVLWLRAPKNGANAIIVPRAFFAPEAWEPLVALVREKLPSAAKAADATTAAAASGRRRQAAKTLLLWALLIALFYGVYQLLGDP